MSTKEFLMFPNIPNKCSESVLVDYRISKESIQTLQSLGITVYVSTPVKHLYSQVSGHPDMQICHMGANRFVAEPDVFSYYQRLWPQAQVLKGKTKLKQQYPQDIAYNSAIIGNFIFHRTDCTDAVIKECLKDKTMIHVKQGYSKCNVCMIHEKAIITSDAGIAAAAQKYDFDVLRIHAEGISLYDMEGFFGGSSGLLAPNLLAVNGDISTHPDASAIRSFCKNYKIDICSLKRGPIEDIGSILPITQKTSL